MADTVRPRTMVDCGQEDVEDEEPAPKEIIPVYLVRVGRKCTMVVKVVNFSPRRGRNPNGRPEINCP